ncbi:lamin tail domain-containing protein [Chitinophagaceae bacterium 26-R-25]|nr:lamin tail domain-containing protein [Chitinophagaceae bacterium 26-R-25]
MKLIYTIAIALSMVGCSSKVEFTVPEVPPPDNQTSDVIISEISTAINTDPNAGGVRNHYVELYNGTRGAIDLSHYAIGYDAVSDATTLRDWRFPDNTTYLKLTGSLESGKCYVIASTQADASIKRDISWGTTSTASGDASKPLQLSGNSGITLLKQDAAGTYMLDGTAYKIIDAFGSPNVARIMFAGSSSSRNNFFWSIAGEVLDTRNRTIWRKGTVRDPSADWATTKGTSATDSQWRLSADRAWDYSNLGLPSTQ